VTSPERQSLPMSESEFAVVLCDGANLNVNDVPWREMYERIVEAQKATDAPPSPLATFNV
jgi:hypothetical protein